MSLPLKNPMPNPGLSDPANSSTGVSVGPKLSGGQGIPQEQPKAVTVGAVLSGGASVAQHPIMKGFEKKPGRSGLVR